MVLEGLTGQMAMLAARRIGESGNAERLTAAYERLQAFRETGGGTAFFDARRAFYDALIDIGGNRQLARLMPLMQIQLLRMQFQPYQTPLARRRQFEDYEAMHRAVQAGDARLAERLAKLHVRRTRIHLMRLPEHAFQATHS
jgi:DNA-binding GntR family transcriptional regulator